MKAKELLCENGELSHKTRSISDLIRHIKTKEEKSTANYSLFLGAGASVTSEIRAATTLIDEWSLELYERFNYKQITDAQTAKEYFEKSHPSWYNPANPYSSLFEKKFDLPSQRRRFVEQEVDRKLPSIGYAYLTSLIDNNYFNTIFTTNFDDLINEAFYQFSNERPIQCAHDSSVHSISITSKRPKIVKLHGDYLFDDIKSTLRETESLEQNTKEKFVEFCKEYGLIVIGYSGSDRSIMDVLEFLVKQENYLKNGIYWCIRAEDEVCHALRNLLWKDKVYPVLIDGFDELLAETHNRLLGTGLDLRSNTKESKLQKTIQLILSDKFNTKKNPTIKKEIESIESNSNSQDISQFLQDLSKGGDADSEIGISDLRNFLEIQSLLEKGQNKEAYALCESQYHETITPATKSKYIEKIIGIAEKLEENSTALRWCEKLIETDNKNIEHYIKKARTITDHRARYKMLDNLLNEFTTSPQLLNYAATTANRIIKASSTETEITLDLVINLLKKSLNLDPGLSNPAWSETISTLIHKKNNIKISKQETILEIDNLIKKAQSHNSEHSRTLNIIIDYAIEKKDTSETKQIIKNLYEIYKKSSISKKHKINHLTSELLRETLRFDDSLAFKEELKFFFESHIKDIEIKNSPQILLDKCKYNIAIKRDIKTASAYYHQALNCPKLTNHLPTMVGLSKYLNPEILNLLEAKLDAEKTNIHIEYYLDMKSDIYVNRKDFDKALEFSNRSFNAGLPTTTYLTSISYILLYQEKYNEIISLSETYKEVTTTPEYEPFIINCQYAAKKIGHQYYDETKVRNLSAQSHSNFVKICAFIILNNITEAKREIKKQIDRSYTNYLTFASWPIIDPTFLAEICSTTQGIAAA